MPYWRTAGPALGSIAALTVSVFAACEGSQFTASDQKVGGAGGALTHAEGGTSDVGGSSSAAGAEVGGEASLGGGAEGGAASGGAPTESCTTNADCRTGRFCKQGSCATCDLPVDVAELEFGSPEPLDVINVTRSQDHLRFPRPGPGSGLVYVRDFFGGRLWFTSDPSKSAGAAVTVAQGVFETGGLYVPFALPEPLAGYRFFFHRAVPASADTTKLFGAKMNDAGAVSGALELPAPLNAANVVSSYSVALSNNRAVWARNNDGALDVHLMTMALPPNGAEPIELRLPMPYECGFATELEYAPWLTPDGSRMLFTARALDDTCAVTTETPTRIYVIALSGSGEPQGVAHALTGLGADDSRQTDAALSHDGCHLFYSATYENGMGLFRAQRLN